MASRVENEQTKNASTIGHPRLGSLWSGFAANCDNGRMSDMHVVNASVTMRHQKRTAALHSLLAAVLITSLKLVVGLTTASLGILSEAAHSGLDLVAAAVTLFSVRVSDLPADAEHQYGHGKVENFSAFIETGLLLMTCVWILWEATRRLFFHRVEIEPTAAAFLVMGLSMALDLWRSRELKRIANRYDSQALHADALHFGTDIFSSGAVVLGLALVLAGHRWSIPWLADADPIAALFVAGIVIYVSTRLARQTVDALLDAAPAGVRAKITKEVARIDGVLEMDRVRIRRAGNRYFADLSVGMGRNLTFQKSEQITAKVTEAVRRVLPDADVVVHSSPRPNMRENVFDRIRAVATRNNLNVHDVSVQELGGRLHVEQHLELDENLRLKDAHEFVTGIEAEMRQQVPEISCILTHIESEPATIEAGDEIARDKALEQRLKAVAREFPEVLDLHEMAVKRVRDKIYLSCHCTMSDDLPLSRVHELATALEIRFKQETPRLFKVLIHPEPQTDNRR
jgi:cation diffusion facilitator family transporter